MYNSFVGNSRLQILINGKRDEERKRKSLV